MAWFFYSDEVGRLISIKEAVRISEDALRDMLSPAGVCAPTKRLNLHRCVQGGRTEHGEVLI